MRISDWSSDVCSSDLDQAGKAHHNAAGHQRADVLANGAGGGAGDQDPDKQQYDASQHLDPFWPGHAPQRQRPKLAEQLGVLFLAGFLVRKHVYRSEEHTSELQSLMRISYAVFCLKKKK